MAWHTVLSISGRHLTVRMESGGDDTRVGTRQEAAGHGSRESPPTHLIPEVNKAFGVYPVLEQ